MRVSRDLLYLRNSCFTIVSIRYITVDLPSYYVEIGSKGYTFQIHSHFSVKLPATSNREEDNELAFHSRQNSTMPADQNQYFICGKCTKPTHNNNSYRSQRCKWCTHEMPDAPEYYCEWCGDSRVRDIQYDAQHDLWRCPRCVPPTTRASQPTMPEGQRDAVRSRGRRRSSTHSQPPDTPGRGESSAAGPQRPSRRRSRPPPVADPYANLPQSPHQPPPGGQGPTSGRSSRRSSMSGREAPIPPPLQRPGSQSSRRSSHASASVPPSPSSHPPEMAASMMIWCPACGGYRSIADFGIDAQGCRNIVCILHTPSDRVRRVSYSHTDQAYQQQGYMGYSVPGVQPGMTDGQIPSSREQPPSSQGQQQLWCSVCNQSKPYFDFPVDNLGLFIPGACNLHFAIPRDESTRGPRESRADHEARLHRRDSAGQQQEPNNRQAATTESRSEPMRMCERCGKQRPKTDFHKGRDGRREALCRRHHRAGREEGDHHRSVREEQRAERRGSRAAQEDRDAPSRSLAERFERFRLS